MANRTVWTPERIALAVALRARGATYTEAAQALRVSTSTLWTWAKRNSQGFADGRRVEGLTRPGFRRSPAFVEAARRNIAKATAASAAKARLPLTAAEREAYDAYRLKARDCGVTVTRADAYRAIGRADLAATP